MSSKTEKSKSNLLYLSVQDKVEELKLKQGHKRESKIIDRLSAESVFFEELESRLERVAKNWKVGSAPKKKSTKKTEPVASLLLSDLHFGSMLGSEVVFPFGALEESRRLASIVDQTVSCYGERTSTLNLYLLGDIIQNQLHDARDGAPLAAQACAAISLLGQAISILKDTFTTQVNVYCATGNHGRFTSRHRDRAVHQKWDSLEHVIYHSLNMMFKNVKNVKFYSNKSHFIQHTVAGHSVFATHGDTIMNVGSPNKTISVRGVESILGRLNGNFDKKVKIFLCGHTHSPMLHPMSNGTYLIMNGALVPSDEFAATQGWLTTASGQWAWLTDEKMPVYDSRFLSVGAEEDRDVELNKIITPYEY